MIRFDDSVSPTNDRDLHCPSSESRKATRRALPLRLLSGVAVNGRYTQRQRYLYHQCTTYLYSTRDDQLQQKDSGPPETADCALSALRRHRMDTGTNRGPEHDAWVPPAAFLRKSAWSLHEHVWGRVVWPVRDSAGGHEDEKSIFSRNDSLHRMWNVLPNRSLQQATSKILGRKSLTEDWQQKDLLFCHYYQRSTPRISLRGTAWACTAQFVPPGFTLSLAKG